MKKFALLGENISYSLSPKIHNVIYKHMGIQADYKLISLSEQQLSSAKNMLLQLDGFNVTKPHKNNIISILDKVENSPVNTVVNENGTLIGYNTDFEGFFNSLKEYKSIIKENASVLLIGAGGASESVAAVFRKHFKVNLFVYDICPQQSKKIARLYGATTKEDKGGNYDIIVNCSTVGLNSGEDASLGIDFSNCSIAYDLIYFNTEFIKKARKSGVKVSLNGLNMLIYQAMGAAEIFLGKKIEGRSELFEKILKILSTEENK